MAEESPSYVKAAFTWQYNLIALAGAAGFALLSGSALPLILMAGLELIFLATVPQNVRFQRLVRSWQLDEEKKKKYLGIAELLKELPQDVRERYGRLSQLCYAIRDNHKRLSTSAQMFADPLEAKLEALSQSYARLLNSAFHHWMYLRDTQPELILKEVEHLKKRLPQETPKVQEINRQRIEILNKRLERHAKITENRAVVDAQLAAIEDVLQLIRDQSVTMRDPQQISDHLDSLVKDVEQTEETVREVESVLGPSPLGVEEWNATPREKTRA